ITLYLSQQCCQNLTTEKAVIIPNIPQIELHLWIPQGIAHFVLFLFVTAEDTNFFYVRMQKASQNGVSE
ncbi:MAG: hypothetical protein QMD11_13355, partial [Smithella sp.]|nr:hypothetical protein [Smithella sp.]